MADNPPKAPQRSDKSSTLGTFGVKSGLAQILKGGLIVDVYSVDQAQTAVKAGAAAIVVTSLPSSVAQPPDPKVLKEIAEAVNIPVIAKVRVGHFVEAQILQALGVDYIDECEDLGYADEEHYINKHNFKVPFVNGAKSLGEALRRISEGSAFIRTTSGSGANNLAEAVRNQRVLSSSIRRASALTEEEVYALAKEIQAPFHLLKETARLKKLPTVTFANLRGIVPSPADVGLLMQLGSDGVFVDASIFGVGGGEARVRALVEAVIHIGSSFKR
ncbi:SOR/SNZ family-domain-containing protein [Flagelloscypha sp. PMI_526]|nr:SOR/SNZ family-domain-containing protein [Flagelloscypha sp. PMI_526]